MKRKRNENYQKIIDEATEWLAKDKGENANALNEVIATYTEKINKLTEAPFEPTELEKILSEFGNSSNSYQAKLLQGQIDRVNKVLLTSDEENAVYLEEIKKKLTDQYNELTKIEEELKNYSTTEYRNNGGTTNGTNNYTYFEDTNTAKQNCDVWMTYVGQQDNYSTPITGVPAVEWCRSITVDGVPCDLPNIQQMIRMWLDREIIESLDPSITTSYKLTQSGYWWWSSTEFSSRNCWGVDNYGTVGHNAKYTPGCVCPVLELNS